MSISRLKTNKVVLCCATELDNVCRDHAILRFIAYNIACILLLSNQ